MLESVTNLGFGGPEAKKIIAELQGLTFSLVAGAAGGTVMAVPNMEDEDTIAQAINLTDLTVPAGLAIADRRAQGTITCLTSLADGDTVVVNGKTYTFKDVDVNICYNTPPRTVPVAIDASGVADAEQAATNLATAIMSGDSGFTCVVEEDESSPPLLAKVRVIWRTRGAGNQKTLTESGGGVTLSGATLAAGSATAGFTSTDNLSGKTVLVVWYNKQ